MSQRTHLGSRPRGQALRIMSKVRLRTCENTRLNDTQRHKHVVFHSIVSCAGICEAAQLDAGGFDFDTRQIKILRSPWQTPSILTLTLTPSITTLTTFTTLCLALLRRLGVYSSRVPLCVKLSCTAPQPPNATAKSSLAAACAFGWEQLFSGSEHATATTTSNSARRETRLICG